VVIRVTFAANRSAALVPLCADRPRPWTQSVFLLTGECPWGRTRWSVRRSGGGPSRTACDQVGQSLAAEAALASPSSSRAGVIVVAALPVAASGIPVAATVHALRDVPTGMASQWPATTPDDVQKRFSIGLLKTRRQAAKREIRLRWWGLSLARRKWWKSRPDGSETFQIVLSGVNGQWLAGVRCPGVR
jgi:hypothetical protein